jgi:hypothetical protein
MPDSKARKGPGAALTAEQSDALWKWRWLGLRGSTPAFKASLVLLAVAALALVAYGIAAAR